MDIDEVALLQLDSMCDVSSGGTPGAAVPQQPSLDVLGGSTSPGWAWIAPPSGDTEEGGTAAGS